jgi:hypothetical protein
MVRTVIRVWVQPVSGCSRPALEPVLRMLSATWGRCCKDHARGSAPRQTE